MEDVYTLLSGRKLDKRSFISYINDKIRKTASQFSIKIIDSNVYCLDDAAIDIVYGMMKAKKIKLKKSVYIHCLRKELDIYGKLKGIDFQFLQYSGLKSDIRNMLDELEKKHPEIKYAVFNAEYQSASSSC